jgi:hypothetical protein
MLMIREEAIKLMKDAACSKTLPSQLALGLTQAVALKLVRHYVRACKKGAELGSLVSERVRDVTRLRRSHG